MADLFAVNPDLRLTAEQVLRHEWVADKAGGVRCVCVCMIGYVSSVLRLDRPCTEHESSCLGGERRTERERMGAEQSGAQHIEETQES